MIPQADLLLKKPGLALLMMLALAVSIAAKVEPTLVPQYLIPAGTDLSAR
jgi:hypothetical protein